MAQTRIERIVTNSQGNHYIAVPNKNGPWVDTAGKRHCVYSVNVRNFLRPRIYPLSFEKRWEITPHDLAQNNDPQENYAKVINSLSLTEARSPT